MAPSTVTIGGAPRVTSWFPGTTTIVGRRRLPLPRKRSLQGLHEVRHDRLRRLRRRDDLPALRLPRDQLADAVLHLVRVLRRIECLVLELAHDLPREPELRSRRLRQLA